MEIQHPFYVVLEPGETGWQPINIGSLEKVFKFHDLPEGTILPLAVYDLPGDFGPVQDYDACVLDGMVLEITVGDRGYEVGIPVEYRTVTWSGGNAIVSFLAGVENAQ